MRSTGNDIVDLGNINKKRTAEPRFYSKILSVSEHALYHSLHQTVSFTDYVWLLWSAKESAYKYLKRNIGELEFAPAKFIIQEIEISLNAGPIAKEMQCTETRNNTVFYCGSISHGSHSLYFRSGLNRRFIMTVVNEDENFTNVHCGVQAIDKNSYADQSLGVRELLVNRIGSFLPGNLQVSKTKAGYPMMVRDSADLAIPVSLAHDGHFVACSFVMDPL